jgi:hypothetical protein
MRIIYSIFFLLIALPTYAQKDTVVKSFFMIGAKVSADFPLADYAKRFGFFDKVGACVYKKTNKNWLIGIRYQYTFGNDIHEPGFLTNVGTNFGGTITTDGSLSEIRIYHRGYNIGLDIGKILPFWNVNANSGPLLQTSFGYTRHWIQIFDRDNLFPQFAGDYKQGYDRLTDGIYADALLGYYYSANKKNVNGYIGCNINMAKTQGKREWWYDVKTSGRDNRLDASVGFVLGWFIPIRQKKVEEIYY